MTADQQLRSRSRAVAYGFFILMALYLLFGPLTLLYLPKENVDLWVRLLPNTPVDSGVRWLTLTLNVPQIVFECALIWLAGSIFSAYADGNFFGDAIVRKVRGIGILLMVLPVITGLTRVLLSGFLAGVWPVWPPLDGTAGDFWQLVDQLWILMADYIVTLLVGFAVYLFADTQLRARALQEETESFV